MIMYVPVHNKLFKKENEQLRLKAIFQSEEDCSAVSENLNSNMQEESTCKELEESNAC